MSNYTVTVSTDVIRGSHNLGGIKEYSFDSEMQTKIFMNNLFKNRSLTFVAGLALSETINDTITASVYKNDLPENVKDYFWDEKVYFEV